MDYLNYKELRSAAKSGDMTPDDVGRELIKSVWSEFAGGPELYTDEQMRAVLGVIRDGTARQQASGWFTVANDAIRVVLETQLHQQTALAELRGATIALLIQSADGDDDGELQRSIERHANNALDYMAMVQGELAVMRDLELATRLPVLTHVKDWTRPLITEYARVVKLWDRVLGPDPAFEIVLPEDAVQRRERAVEAFFSETLVPDWRTRVAAGSHGRDVEGGES